MASLTTTKTISITSPADFAAALLAALHIPVTNQRVADIVAWENAEGQWGARGQFNANTMHDPLNTKLMKYGGTPIGGGATNTYPSWLAGIDATRDTLLQSNMAPILDALRSGGSPSKFNSALHVAPWAQSLYGGKPIAVAVKNPNASYKSGVNFGSLSFWLNPSTANKDITNAAGSAARSLAKDTGLTAVGDFFSSLGKWTTWKRVFEVGGGAILVGAGLVLMTKEAGIKTPSVAGGVLGAAKSIPGVGTVVAAAQGAQPTEKIHIAHGIESTVRTNRQGTKQTATHKPIVQWWDNSGENV